MAPRQWTCLARTAQFEATPRESDPRSTADAQRAPVRIRYARNRNPGQQKTRHAVRRGFWKLPDFAFSRGKRSLRPPSSSSGRRSVLCCVLSCCSYSLASAGNVCWAKPNHGFFSCQQPGATFFGGRLRRHTAASPWCVHAGQACASRVQHRVRNAFAKTPGFFAVLCFRSSVFARVVACRQGSAMMPLASCRGHRNRLASRCSQPARWRVAQADLRESARTPSPPRMRRRGANSVLEACSKAIATCRSRLEVASRRGRFRSVQNRAARIARPPDRNTRTDPAAKNKTGRTLAAGLGCLSPQLATALLSPVLPTVRRSRPGRAVR